MHFTEAQIAKALETFHDLKSATKTVRLLGYPSTKQLYKWIKKEGQPRQEQRKRYKLTNTPKHPAHAPLKIKLEAIHRCYAEPRGEALPDGPEMAVGSDLPPLTDEQGTALASLVEDLDKDGFRATLLHGVTGSGKTRVYQELVREALARNKRVLILVPEIGLTPQTAARFADFLKIPIVVLHSALSAPKKREGYLSVLDGSARVVLGTRSAILSPFEFNVVILDEEHDSSFKQQDPAPRYHTRDLAFHLAQKYGALVVLGSATPCLETYRNAKAGNLKLLTLKKRATAAPLPEVTVVDMGKVRQQKDVLMSPALRDALSECIASGNQAIILMNRRGYSKIRVCSECLLRCLKVVRYLRCGQSAGRTSGVLWLRKSWRALWARMRSRRVHRRFLSGWRRLRLL